MSDKPLWNLDRVSLAGRHGPRLEQVTLPIHAGVTAVVGYSGAGKTSLLNLLVEFERPTSGTIERHLASADRPLELFWAPQDFGLWPFATTLDHLQAVAPSSSTADIDRLLDQFDLTSVRDARPDSLSQGERSRLSVARALASRAGVLVMDEPLAHVDPARLDKYWSILRTAVNTGVSLIFSSHDPATVLREAHSAVCFDRGKIVCSGRVDELYHRPQTEHHATFFGPANWLTPADAELWIGVPFPESRCVRPEQLDVRVAGDSDLVVDTAHFSGAVAEVIVQHVPTQSRRRFWHRPTSGNLRRGDKVTIHLCLLWLMLWFVSGCGPAAAPPELAFQNINYWSMPPDGRRVPAPRGVFIGPEDEAYVLDTAGRVLVFDTSGKEIRRWDMPESSVGKPERLLRLNDGRIAVADTHYHRVIFFDTTGKELSRIGKFGRATAEFIYPVALAQDDTQHLYVAEYGEHDRIQKFTNSGEFVLEFGSFGTAPGQFQRPSGLAWHAGKVYVVDAFNNRIQVFSEDGKFEGMLGEGAAAVAMQYPYDIAIHSPNEMYIVEYGGACVLKLDLQGRLLGRFGHSGPGEREFQTPWGLAVDQHGRILVADTGNRRIVELAP